MALTPTQKKRVRAAMKNYCLRAEANEAAWHYSQARPFRYVDNPDSRWVVADCSAYVGIVYHDAMHDTGLYLRDPLGYKYEGIGNTWTEEAWFRANGKPVAPTHKVFVGDIVRWGHGDHSHTAICRTSGSRSTAWFSSFGREAGPQPVRLNYRDDLVGVWRHPALL